MNDPFGINRLREAFKNIQLPKLPDIANFRVPDPLVPSIGSMRLVNKNQQLEKIGWHQLSVQEKQNILLKKLIKTIKENDTKNEALGKKMYWLTWIAIALTATQVIPAIDTVCKWMGKCQ